MNYAKRNDVCFVCFFGSQDLFSIYKSSSAHQEHQLRKERCSFRVSYGSQDLFCICKSSSAHREHQLRADRGCCHGILHILLCSHTFGELISFPASILSTFLHAFKAFFARKALPSYRTSGNHGEFVTSFGYEDWKQAPDSNKWNLLSQWKTPMQFLKWIYRQEV